MSDVTHDVVDDGFHEIHLSGKQLFFLFMATVVVSVVIFLIGVFVGRSVRAQQTLEASSDTPAVASPAPAAAVNTAAPAETVPDVAEPPVPPAETEVIPERASAAPPREEPRAAESPRPAPEPAPAAAAPAASASGVVGTPRPGTWVVQVHALRDRTVANGIVRRLVAKGYPAFVVPAGPPTGTYKVQVGRYKDRSEAVKVIDRLRREEQFKPWITR